MTIIKYEYEETVQLCKKYNRNPDISNVALFKIDNKYLALSTAYTFNWYVGYGNTEKEAIKNMKYCEINQYDKSNPLNNLLLDLVKESR